MISKLRFSALTVLFWLMLIQCEAQKIVSGPMPGYSTMTEVAVWTQLDMAGMVQLEYWNSASPETRLQSDVIQTSKQTAFTAKFTLSQLTPGSSYRYEVLIDGIKQDIGRELRFNTQTLWQFRSDPPEFKVALGSCTYVNEGPFDRPGKAYGGGYEIFETIANHQPDMMLWMGDNIYLREVDWNSRSGYLHRYSHTRALPEMQSLLQSTHHYAIWDDHDFGPNDANGAWLHKDWALESFEMFWANPTVGTPDLKGSMTAFEFNDIDFILLDNRYHRSADRLKNGATQILGKDQIEWLIQMLKFSKAPFKMVAIGGQVLNPAAVYETYSVYAEERAYLLRRIEEEEISGVVFLSGDRHHTELSKYEAANGIVIYDLTVSPLTSGTHSSDDEANTLRIPNTLTNVRNYGILTFSGERRNRSMKISIFDQEGNLKWEKILAEDSN